MLAVALVLGSIPNRPGTKLRLQHQALGFVYAFHADLLTNLLRDALYILFTDGPVS